MAKSTLADQPNVQFHQASVAASGLTPNSQDFGYSLGVLHHVPDTADAIRSCAELLKPGAPLLLYLYYATGTRPRWFRWLWRLSNAARDRLGTPLEQRFSRAKIRAMCSAAGLVDLRFSPRAPYWCVVGFKA